MFYSGQQKKGSAQSTAPSAPPTPAKNTPPPLFLSSPALGRSPGDLVSEPPTSTPQRQRVSLGTSGSPSASHKRAGDPQSTPKGAKKLKLDTAVWESVSYAWPPESVATASALTTWYPSVRSVTRPAFLQNSTWTSASHAICSHIARTMRIPKVCNGFSGR